MRSISNHTNKMLRGEILEGIKKKSEEKKRRDSKKKFPQNMKIVYYGPIGKSPLKF